jgi:hypothetical protein
MTACGAGECFAFEELPWLSWDTSFGLSLAFRSYCDTGSCPPPFAPAGYGTNRVRQQRAGVLVAPPRTPFSRCPRTTSPSPRAGRVHPGPTPSVLKPLPSWHREHKEGVNRLQVAQQQVRPLQRCGTHRPAVVHRQRRVHAEDAEQPQMSADKRSPRSTWLMADRWPLTASHHFAVPDLPCFAV